MDQNGFQMLLRAIAIAERKFSYNTGHGDFAFGRIIDIGGGYPSTLLPGHRENNVRFVELNGFVRSGPFPFQKLPIEIRNRIFTLLLGPCYSLNKCIEVNILALDFNPYEHPTESGWWNKTDDDYRLQPEGRYLRGHLLTGEQHEERKSRIHTQGLPHPDREGHYYVKVEPTLALGPNQFSPYKDWSMITLIRNVSNVSTHFRKEFANVFWGRTKILLEDDETYNSLLLLPDFLAHRPSVCNGIRELDVFLPLYVITLNDDEEEQRFLEFCQVVAGLPQLEVLRIRMCIWDDMGDDLEPGTRMHRCFKAMRTIPVKKDFKIMLVVKSTRVWDDADQHKKYIERLECEWARKIAKLALPNTLRASKDKSAWGKYLHSRPIAEAETTELEDGAEGQDADMEEEENVVSSDEEDDNYNAEEFLEE